MSTTRRSAPQSIAVREVWPDWAKSPPTLSPSRISTSSGRSSHTSPSGKRVSFSEERCESRPLTTAEAWSLYHFEDHARSCQWCNLPHDSLCTAGHGLARDVAIHVFHKDGDIYGCDDKLVRVEVPKDYFQVRTLLKRMARYRASRRRPSISYDDTFNVRRRDSVVEAIEPRTAMLQPTSGRTKQRHRYSAQEVFINPDDESDSPDSGAKRLKERRGSLYEKDQEARRRKGGYVVEVRQPRTVRRDELHTDYRI